MKPFCAPQDKAALPCESQHQTFSNAQEVDRVPWALFSLIGVFVVAEQATYPSSFFFFFLHLVLRKENTGYLTRVLLRVCV